MRRTSLAVGLCSMLAFALTAQGALALEPIPASEKPDYYWNLSRSARKAWDRQYWQQKAQASSSSASAEAVAMAMNTEAEKRLQCLKTAMLKREKLIQDGFTAYYNYVTTALKARESALGVAADQRDVSTRQANFKSVWKGFGFTWRDSGNKMREIRTEAWRQFRDDRIGCGIPDSFDDERGGLGMDSQF